MIRCAQICTTAPNVPYWVKSEIRESEGRGQVGKCDQCSQKKIVTLNLIWYACKEWGGGKHCCLPLYFKGLNKQRKCLVFASDINSKNILLQFRSSRWIKK